MSLSYPSSSVAIWPYAYGARDQNVMLITGLLTLSLSYNHSDLIELFSDLIELDSDLIEIDIDLIELDSDLIELDIDLIELFSDLRII